MRKVLIGALALILTAGIALAAVDTFEGQTATDTWEGVSTTDTREGQAVAAGGCTANDFADDWEDNVIADEWSAEEDSGGNLDVASAPGTGHGSYSLHHLSATTAEARLRKIFAADYTSDVWIQFYVRWDAVTGWDNQKTFRFMTIYDNSWNEVAAFYFRSDVSGNLTNLTGYGAASAGGTISPAADTWYPVKIHVKKGTGSDGVIQVWFNETLEVDISNETRTYNTRTIDFGCKWSNMTLLTLNTYFDDFQVRTDDCFD